VVAGEGGKIWLESGHNLCYANPMKEIGTFEAKNQLSALLELVAQGEDIVITRHGRPVARLVPPEPVPAQGLAREAAARLRARAEAAKGGFSWDEWKAYRDEGRR
jgi:prevent-host-death family protein